MVNLEKIIVMQNKHWNKKYSGLHNRTILKKILEKIDLKQIEIIQGIRRSGKSTIFKLIINHLIKNNNPKEILYVNLDDPIFLSYSDDASNLYKLLEVSEKLTNIKPRFLFLDEVQNINNWEKFVKSIYDSEVVEKIFITGSNSKLLNGKYASLLSGRYFSNMIFPFSYKEILSIHNINTELELIENKPRAQKLLDEILKYGSFPEVVNAKESQKRELLKSYYDTIILKDCIFNNKIRDIKTFKELAFYLLSNNACLHSYNSLSKIFEVHDKSIRDYLEIMESAYIINEIKQYSFSVKKQIKSKRKFYFSDPGFSALSFAFSENKGRTFEALVFAELKKYNEQIYYHINKYECDFIVKNNNSVNTLIQVCWDLNNLNLKRELAGINNPAAKFNSAEKIIITYDQEDVIENVKIIPFRKIFGPLNNPITK